MSHPILAKLPEHLDIIKKVSRDPVKIVLAALLTSETELIWNASLSDVERVEKWASRFKEEMTHDGDCISCSAPCLLCHTLDDITIMEECIEESNLLFGVSNDPCSSTRLLQLIEILLSTQPEKKYNSLKELYAQISSVDDIGKALDYEDNLAKRVEQWQNLDNTIRAEKKELIQDLLKAAT